MATFGEPELSILLSIQEKINIISSYLALWTTTSVLLIIYIYCLVELYFNILLIITNTTINTTNYIPYNTSIYDDEPFSL